MVIFPTDVKVKQWFNAGIGSKSAAIILGFNTNESKFDEWIRIQKTMKIVDNLDQDGDAWLKWREKGIGSSDVATILGLSKYKSKKAEYKSRTSTDKKKSNSDNIHTRRGKQWEPIVRSYYNNLMNMEFIPICIISEEYDWARVSLDGWRVPDGKMILEVKCPTSDNWHKIQQVGIHDYWQAQIQYQLWVSQAKICHCLVFDAENVGLPYNERLQVVEIYPDEVFIAAMISELSQFWYCVQNRIPPI